MIADSQEGNATETELIEVGAGVTPLPENEAARLAALLQCKILDTPAESGFDDITRLAAHICSTPIALVSLVDADRQWFKSKVGLEATETPRNIAFCAHAILQPDVLIVPNALNDERFANNPLVTSNPNIRFYAGVPLITPEGYALGTLCVADYVPRELSLQQVEALRALGRQVVGLLELRRNLAELERTVVKRQQGLKGHRQFLKRVAAGFGLVSAILVAVGVVSYRSITEFVAASNQAAQTQQVLGELKDVLSQIKDAETGQRGYLLTGDESYLEPYRTAVKFIDREVKELQRLTTNNPNLDRQINTLESLLAKKFAYLKQTIDLRKDKGVEAALKIDLTKKGKTFMDEIRAYIREIENEQQTLLKQRSRSEATSARHAILTVLAGILLNFFILAGVYYFICREITERQQTEVALEQERDFIFAILDTVGALVVVLDPQGRIVRFNRACEQTTGYSFTEVKGKYFWQLFLSPEEVEPVKALFENLQKGHSYCNQNHWVTREGERRLISWSNTTLIDTGAVEYVIGCGIDITERQRVEEQVNLLQTLMLEVGEAQDFNSALKTILCTVCETKGWNYGEAWIPCSEENMLKCSPAYCSHSNDREGVIQLELEKFRRLSEEFTFPLGVGLPGRVWLSKQPEWQEDASRELDAVFLRANLTRDYGLRTVLGIPLVVNEQVLAVLVFFKFESCKQDMRLIESISAVATQLGALMQRKRMEQVLRESEERFKTFMNNSPAVAFMKDEEGRYVYVNQPFERCFNMKLTNWLGRTDFDVLPEEIAQQLRANDTNVLTADKSVELIETIPTPDGSSRYWLSFKFPCKDLAGRRLLGGVAIDITERKQAEEALQQANEKLRGWVNELEVRNREIALLGHMSDILQACLTVEEAYRAIATLLQPLFPYHSGGIYLISASKNLVEAVATWGSAPLTSQKLFTPNDCWALRRGRGHHVEYAADGLVCQHIHRDLSDAESLCVPMMAQGEALGVLYLHSQEKGQLTETKQRLAATVAEQTALALANLKLRETLQNHSIRDPLTGLFNRRYMEESLEREVHRAERKQQPLGIIMLDVDHFKHFNDTFGHEAGDVVLRELGLFLKKHTRGSDIACRYGGEELTLILPETCLNVTKQRAEQIREGIKHLNVQHRRQPLGAITLSLGVACFPEHGFAGETVIQAADAALYRAKKQGRDRVVAACSAAAAFGAGGQVGR